MEKKNIVIVVIVAIICALLTALFLIKSPKNGPVLIPEEQKTVIEQPAVESVLPTEETIKEEGEQEQKTVEKPLSKPVTKPTTPIFQTPVIKPIQVEEEKTMEVFVEKAVQDAGIIKDSGEIVITREFKSQSPSKYSFVGFGEQKAPTK